MPLPKINSFLVKRLGISNQQAESEIRDGKVMINGVSAILNQVLKPYDEVFYKHINLHDDFFYFAYNKPIGVESTQNRTIKNNLIEDTGISAHFFPVGRLDKASEGLMILTNDGNLYRTITDQKNKVEKVYEVRVNKSIDIVFINAMQEGVMIMNKKTSACKLRPIEECVFEIKLFEGRNRQIRRMCYKLGYEVLSLKRIAIGKMHISKMNGTALKKIERKDIV